MRVFAVSVLFFLCPDFTFGQFEGKIVYEISYESTDPSNLGFMSMLPSSATLWIRDTKSRFEQSLSGGGRQLFINDSNDGSSVFLMTYFGQEFLVRLNKENIGTLAQTKSIAISTSDESVALLGYSCRKAVAMADGKALEILYNDELSQNSYLPQFADVKGIPFAYEMVQNGIHMKFRATEVNISSIPDFIFNVPESIREVSFEDFAKSFAIKL